MFHLDVIRRYTSPLLGVVLLHQPLYHEQFDLIRLLFLGMGLFMGFLWAFYGPFFKLIPEWAYQAREPEYEKRDQGQGACYCFNVFTDKKNPENNMVVDADRWDN